MAGKIKKVGVIGAGQMGNGIAHVCALAGYDVLLSDLSAERVKAGLATINGNLARQVSRGTISEEARQQALGKIKPAEKTADLGSFDFNNEATTEKEDIKRKILVDLCPSLKPDA